MGKHINRLEFTLELSRIGVTDHLQIAKLISKIERNDPSIIEFLKNCPLNRKIPLSIGITGGAGVGKSTFIDRFAFKALEDSKTVAIIAIDPTSKITNGTFLGDRLCFSSMLPRLGVYIRSVASLNSIDGIPQNLGAMIKCLKVIGFDIILVETIGVGQDDIMINNYVDKVITIPSNDSDNWAQQLKLGLHEVTDLYFVNKTDKVDTSSIILALKEYFEINARFEKNSPNIVEGSAKQSLGINRAYDLILER